MQPETRSTLQRAVHIARGAAIIIRTCGLHKGEFFPQANDGRETTELAAWWEVNAVGCPPPPMCAVGAARYAATGTAVYFPGEEAVALDLLIGTLGNQIADAPDSAANEHPSDALVWWSDLPETSAEMVADAFELVADILDCEAA